MNTKTAIKRFCPSPEGAVLSDDLTRMAELIDRVVPGRGKEIVVQLARGGFAGTYVYFLQDEKMFRGHRDQWIIEQYDAGYRVPEIARAVGLSERQVWNILGREPGEDKQMRLF